MKKNTTVRPRYYETAARASQASFAQRPLQAGARDAAPQQRGMSSTTQDSLTQATFASFPLSAATQRQALGVLLRDTTTVYISFHALHACRPQCAVQKHCSVIAVHLKEGIGPCRAIAEVLGYTHCTAVQAESLGPLLSGADMVVKAKTGTGKTLAFLIPGIEQVSSLTSSLHMSTPTSFAYRVFVTPCELTGKPAVLCAILATTHSSEREG